MTANVMKRRLLLGFSTVTGVAVIATALFFAQHGFGGGHGNFDQVLFVLSLPWSTIPWPSAFSRSDFTWLVALPFILNLAVVAIVGVVLRHRASGRR